MKKIILLAMTMLMAMHGVAQEEFVPQWLQDLQNKNPGFIDSVLYYPRDFEAPDTRTYVIYFHQPMKHAVPDGPSFPMRALITVDNEMDPTTAVNHVYCTGYSLYPCCKISSSFNIIIHQRPLLCRKLSASCSPNHTQNSIYYR